MDKLPEEIIENRIPYTLHGEYYLPNIVLASTDDRLIGKWGRMHKKYLMKHRPVLYNHLVFTDKLHAYLVTVDDQAQSRMEQIITDMAAAEGVNEALKAADQMEWVRRMNSIRSRAEEIIRDELIFS